MGQRYPKGEQQGEYATLRGKKVTWAEWRDWWLDQGRQPPSGPEDEEDPRPPKAGEGTEAEYI